MIRHTGDEVVDGDKDIEAFPSYLFMDDLVTYSFNLILSI